MTTFPAAPGYWMHETGGALRPVILAYLEGEKLDIHQVATMRAYLRQWIAADCWRGCCELDELRRDVDGLQDDAAIRRWLRAADLIGIDPL